MRLRGDEQGRSSRAKQAAWHLALLKESSASCRSQSIHDGRFSGHTVAQSGVSSAPLRDAGIAVFSEGQFDKADAWLADLE